MRRALIGAARRARNTPVKQRILSFGGRLAIPLSRPILRELGLAEGSIVEVRLDVKGRRIEMTPIAEPRARAEVRQFVHRVDDFIARHKRALERLAQ